MPLTRKRHNKIVDRICRAAGNRWHVYKRDQPIERERLRPDIILTKGRQAIVINVACPFENGPGALNASRENKIKKYTNLVNEMLSSHRFDRVTIEPFIVGALGS